MKDEKIIEMYLKRDENAVSETNKKYGGLCGRIARNILRSGEDAEEALNDTYLGVWNSIPPTVPDNFQAYICAITRNICLKRVRSESAAKRGSMRFNAILDEISECVPSSEDVEREVEGKELTEYLNSFLKNLGNDERRLFVRRYFYCDATEKIAKDMGFSESKTRAILYRLRKRLRRSLEKDGLL